MSTPKTNRKRRKKALRTHDLKVQQGTNTRLLSVGRIIPREWDWVRVHIDGEEDGWLTVRFQQIKYTLEQE